jgi:hypothetical protein
MHEPEGKTGWRARFAQADADRGEGGRRRQEAEVGKGAIAALQAFFTVCNSRLLIPQQHGGAPGGNAVQAIVLSRQRYWHTVCF